MTTTATHENFISSLEKRIGTFLELLQEGSDNEIASFADTIEPGGSAGFTMANKSRRSPDATYGHHEETYPSLIIEVAFSQKPKDLPALAKDYLAHCNGYVNTVLCLGIQYRTPPQRSEPGDGQLKATLAIWTRENFEKTGEPFIPEREWRRPDGTPSDDITVELKLKNLCPQEFWPQQGQDKLDGKILKITRDNLLKYIRRAEYRQGNIDKTTKMVFKRPRGSQSPSPEPEPKRYDRRDRGNEDYTPGESN